MISDDREADGISAIETFAIGERKFCEHVISALIPVCKRCGCGDDHATAFDFGQSDIAPPVHGDHFPIGIPNSSANEKETRVIGEEAIVLERCSAVALIFIDTEYGEFFCFNDGCETWRHGLFIVAASAAIEFDAASEPSVSDCQVAGEKACIFQNDVPFFNFIIKRPESSAEFREKNSFEIFIFEDDRLER